MLGKQLLSAFALAAGGETSQNEHRLISMPLRQLQDFSPRESTPVGLKDFMFYTTIGIGSERR